MNRVIEVENLTRVYSSTKGLLTRGKENVVAVDNISFHVSRGELFGFLGPNGAGKTTTIKMLTTVLMPTEGKATILGHDLVRDSKKIRRLINVVYGGDKGLYTRVSAWDNMKYFCNLYHIPGKEQTRKIEELLTIVGLGEYKHRRVENFSRGMKQKLHIARGLINDPAILFLDEPTIGLDPVSALGIKKVVKKLNKEGVTIFLTTHYMHEAEELCDRVAIIRKGKIIILDTVEKIKALHKKFYEIKLTSRDFEQEFSDMVTTKYRGAAAKKQEDGSILLCFRAKEIDSVLRDISSNLEDLHIMNLEIRTSSLEDAYIEIINSEDIESLYGQNL